MPPLDGTLAERGSHFLKAPEHVVVQSDDLSDDNIGVLPIFHETLHHGTEQRLREPRCAI